MTAFPPFSPVSSREESTQRGLTAATKLEDWVDYAIRSDCAPYSLAQFDNLAQKTRLSRLVVQGRCPRTRHASARRCKQRRLMDHLLHVTPRRSGRDRCRVRNSRDSHIRPGPDSARKRSSGSRGLSGRWRWERLPSEITRNPGPESQNEILRHLCSC
jgi:hypothetical protein